MRFPIDVVAIDRSLHIIRIWENVAPWRICGLSFKTSAILELPAGQSRQSEMAIGDQLRIESAAKAACCER
jgi:uncharacterized membrane protein (UPF0127 family)